MFPPNRSRLWKEPDQPEATAADEEDFLSEGLMEELASAEQAVEPTAKAPATVEDTAVEGEPAVVEEAALPTETMTEETVEAPLLKWKRPNRLLRKLLL
jgi:hypothetical protein